RIAAGLDFPDSGEVLIDGRVVASSAGIDLPPEKRKLGLVFQDGALFPHLTVYRNVSYGLSGLSRVNQRGRVSECLDLVKLTGKEKRYPHELSGGERQRLALARALAPKPRLLLLDEPFSSLDLALRRELREEIRDILGGLGQTALLVTHDPEDALALATRVAVLEKGQIRQVGTPDEIYRLPIDQYCAERFGPANRVVDGESGKVFWKRPEDAEWIADSTSDVGWPVRVLSVRSGGRNLEVNLISEDGEDARWVCLFDLDIPLTTGAQGRVVWRGLE
ncbi:MAG: ABC transporter ATP-binding protein, partial [Verrucomicrobiota bacterium]